MKRILLSMAALCVAASSFAGALDRKDVSADPALLAHVDIGRNIMNSWWKKFNAQQSQVDRALRAAKPVVRLPDADLHDSIMRAVSAARRSEEPARPAALTWWLSGAVAAAFATAVLWLHPRPPLPTPQKMAIVTEMAGAPGAALDLGAQAPALIMAPLTNEMARLDQDVHSATAVLLGSFP